MSVADAEVQEQQTGLSRPDQGEIFLARREDLRLVKMPRYPMFGAAGQKVGELPGEAIQFRNNRFFCPYEGTVELADGRPGDAAEILQWLLAHKAHGNAEEGFWVVDKVAPSVSQAEMQVLMDAALALDEEKLTALVAQERDGWGRESVIRTAEQALERIGQMKEAAAAQQALEQPAKPAAKAAKP